jgi:molybdopterin/thiamine biosynthesis adenylyltransferase
MGGRLLPFEESRKLPISLIIETPELISTQHLAWMLVNLMVRLEGYVEKVSVRCPRGVQLAPFVIPWHKGSGDFRDVLLAEGNRFQLVPVTADEECSHVLALGPGGSVPRNGWRVHGEGWRGGISRRGIQFNGSSALPFGPYISACLAAGELFKQCRIKPELQEQFDSCFFSSWSIASTDHEPQDGPKLAVIPPIAFDLAGVGAVGNSFLHTLATVPGLRVAAGFWDNDIKGVDETNLNRYVLFGRQQVGSKKTNAAVEVLRGTGWDMQPHNQPFSECEKACLRVISTVDTNVARQSVQLKYAARIISGSTHDLRAEVLRCGPPGEGACLRCFNPPELTLTDDLIIDKLKRLSSEELKLRCRTAAVSLEEARSWLQKPKCGQEGERLLAVMRSQGVGPEAFAVGFVSVLAGTLVAAELIKDVIAADVPLNDRNNRLSFQFMNSLAETNSAAPLGRDPACPSCIAGEPRAQIWKKRFDALEPRRV